MNPPLMTLRIFGRAEPAGSKRAFVRRGRGGRIITHNDGKTPVIGVLDANKKSAPWKQEIAGAAEKLWRGRSLLMGPLRLELVFVRARPKAHFSTSKKNPGQLKPDAPIWCTTPPDVLKLTRAVEDALNGVVWRDDALIVDESIRKVYGSPEGVYVRLYAATFGEREATFLETWNPQ